MAGFYSYLICSKQSRKFPTHLYKKICLFLTKLYTF
jgi:hypothetical protein